MKQIILLSLSILLSSSTTFGQTNDFFIGSAFSFHNEVHNQLNYGFGNEDRRHSSQFYGTGIRLQKRFKKTWGLNFGLNYVNRQQDIKVPYNHCYFIEPGEGCHYVLKYVEQYGYRTIELPLGINKYLVTRDKWELYTNVNVATAFDFQSYYNPSVPRSETQTIHEFNLFSGSLTSSVGFAYNLTNNLKVNVEPFVRMAHTQRRDPILSTAHKWTFFDNFGGHVLLLYRL